MRQGGGQAVQGGSREMTFDWPHGAKVMRTPSKTMLWFIDGVCGYPSMLGDHEGASPDEIQQLDTIFNNY